MNISLELRKPLPFNSHKWRAMQTAKDNRKAKAAFYIDARDVMTRLDKIVGTEWSDEYQVLHSDDNKWVVQCRLTIAGATRADVGEGSAAKDAYSDALKRAAVKFGVGRYLYSLDAKYWQEIDQYKSFTDEANGNLGRYLSEQLDRFNSVIAQMEKQSAAVVEEDIGIFEPA